MKKFLQLMASEASWGEPLKDYDGNVVRTTMPNGTQINLRNYIIQFKALSGYFYSNGCTITMSDDLSYAIATEKSYGNEVNPNRYPQRIENSQKNHLFFLATSIRVDSGSERTFQYLGNNGKSNLFPITSEWTRMTGVTQSVYKSFIYPWVVELQSHQVLETFYWKNEDMIFDLTEMFASCSELMPSTADEFYSMLWSEGSDVLGYIPYSDSAVAYTVHNGRLFKTE